MNNSTKKVKDQLKLEKKAKDQLKLENVAILHLKCSGINFSGLQICEKKQTKNGQIGRKKKAKNVYLYALF